MTSFSTEEFLTVAEVSAYLKLNAQTVRNTIFSTVFGVCPATVRPQRRCAD
jgi:Fic family protein